MHENSCIQIFKYRSLSGQFGRESVERAIVDNLLYWQTPALFNDPFDCNPVLFLGKSRKQRAKFFNKASAEVYRNQSRSVRRFHRRNMIKVSAFAMENALKNEWVGWLKNSAVACFSELGDHPLMWAHYADSHRGICLVFQETIEETHPFFAIPVIYQNTRPHVDLTKMADPAVAGAAIFCKADHWSYEMEQRMFVWGEAPGYRPFPASCLTGIILGAKISESDEKFVRNLLAKTSLIDIFRAKISESTFDLEVVKL